MSKDRSLFNPPSTRFADEQRTQMRQIQRPVEEPVKEQRVEVNEAQHLNIDSCIKRLIQVGMNKQIGKSVCLNSSEITAICRSVYEIFMNQPVRKQSV